MSKWKPIETAPKERGVLLLAYAPDPSRIMVWDAGLLAMAMAKGTPDHLRFEATHWMPLPEPPK